MITQEEIYGVTITVGKPLNHVSIHTSKDLTATPALVVHVNQWEQIKDSIDKMIKTIRMLEGRA